MIPTLVATIAALAATQGGYQRRQDEWDFQVRLADRELTQIDQQITTAKLQLDSRKADLTALDPAALLRLKSTGECVVQVPEAWFDLDHPGHYMRRHRAVSLSIPCVAGPYTSVACKLTLLSNWYRKNTAMKQGAVSDKDKYAEDPGNDPRFAYQIGPIQSIATSGGQSDSGLFELAFRDDRYLPFEGTGVIAAWQLELPATFRQWDYNTIRDVVIHVRYTARDGGGSFRALAENVQRDMLNEMLLAAGGTGLFQACNVRQQFPNEWARLKQTKTTQLMVGMQHLPTFVQGHTPVVDAAKWFAKLDGSPALYVMSMDGANFNLNRDTKLGNLCTGPSAAVTLDSPFTLAATDVSKLEELTVLLHYTATT